MRWFKVLPLFTLALAVLSFPSARQLPYAGAGGIEGVVLDQAGIPIMQAKVQACNVMQGGCLGTVTQYNGFYRISGLAGGRYSLWAEADRHASVWMPLIIVEEGKTTRQDIELRREIPTLAIPPTTIE